MKSIPFLLGSPDDQFLVTGCCTELHFSAVFGITAHFPPSLKIRSSVLILLALALTILLFSMSQKIPLDHKAPISSKEYLLFRNNIERIITKSS